MILRHALKIDNSSSTAIIPPLRIERHRNPRECMEVSMKRLISLTELRARMGDIGRTTLWRLQKQDPDFPVLVEISRGRTGVYEDEAEAYIASRPRKALGRVEG